MGNTPPLSLGERVYLKLEGDILSGEIPKGEQLVECAICEKYGVSRTPVRDALKLLEKKRLVRIIPNKGAVVLGLSKKDIIDIYDIRLCTEGLACSLAARNNSNKELLEELKEAIELLEFYEARGNSSQMQELDYSFHNIIYKMSQNAPLYDMLSGFHHVTCAYRQKALSNSARASEAVLEHRKIYEAIALGDEEKAASLARIHIQRAKEALLKTEI